MEGHDSINFVYQNLTDEKITQWNCCIAFCDVCGRPDENDFFAQQKLQNPSRMQEEIGVFIKGDVEKIKAETQALGGVFKYSAGDIVAVRMPLGAVPQLATKDYVSRIECNDMRLQELCDTMAVNNNVWPVHSGF